MINLSEIEEIEKTVKEILQKLSVADVKLLVALEQHGKEDGGTDTVEDIVDLTISLKEPQFLIGQNGQTLLDLQRILKIILNKRLKKSFYVKLDINDYQKQKTEYLKNLAQSLVEEVIATKEKKVLPPMPAHERRIIHEELSKRQDVATESQGEGRERCIAIIPK